MGSAIPEFLMELRYMGQHPIKQCYLNDCHLVHLKYTLY